MKLFLNKLTVLTLFIALLFAGCKRELTEGIDTIINTNVYIAPTVVSFVNANETSPVQPRDFTVTITGKDAAKVVMQSGGTNFKVVGGMLQLALLSDAIPTATKPITFNVNVAVDSFAPTSQTIIIDDTTSTVQTVKMVDYYNPVNGTSSKIEVTSLSGGTSLQQIIRTPIVGDATEKATITIPAGTIMQDVNGNTINAATLKSEIVYFSPNTSSSLDAFPGGLEPKDVIGPGGTPIVDGTSFKTAGLVSINMKAGNTEVKKFSTPINVNVEINKNLVNPETGVAVKSGDKIPIWSMNEETGQWKYESEATVTLDANGTPYVAFLASHLSPWNIDWFIRPVITRCFRNINIRVTTSDQSNYESGNYDIILATPNFSPLYNSRSKSFYYYWQSGFIGGNYGRSIRHNSYYSFWNTFISTQTAQVIILDKLTGQVVARSAPFTACSNFGTITLNVTRPAPPKIFTVNLLAYGKCSNKNALSYFNGWLYFQKNGSYNGRWVYAYNGRASFQLEDGANYYIYGVDYTTYRSASGYGTVSSSIIGNFTVNGLTCTGSYNPTTSIYNLTVTQNVICK
jgi:hypothetical protein